MAAWLQKVMDISEEVGSGAFLCGIFSSVVESSLKKVKGGNVGKNGALQKVFYDFCLMMIFFILMFFFLYLKVSEVTVSKLNSVELELNIEPSDFNAYAHVRRLVIRDQIAAAFRGLELSKLLAGSPADQPHEEGLQHDEPAKETQQIPQVLHHHCLHILFD